MMEDIKSKFMVTIGIADDHAMFRKGLAGIIESFGGYQVMLQAANGKEFIDQLKVNTLPDIALLDINMPEMDGFETAAYLQKHYPTIKVLAVSMMDTEYAILRMIKNGARGYVLKDADPSELKQAFYDLMHKDYYLSELVSGKLIYNMNHPNTTEKGNHRPDQLSDKELEFLKLACTELTYREIAAIMHLSPRTVDGYRDGLFEKLGVKTRVGLAMYAVKRKLFSPA